MVIKKKCIHSKIFIPRYLFCFGLGKKTHHLINTIIFYAKYFIYKTKYEEKNLSFLRFTKELDFLQQVEHIIAFRKGKKNTHKQKWRPVFDLIFD